MRCKLIAVALCAGAAGAGATADLPLELRKSYGLTLGTLSNPLGAKSRKAPRPLHERGGPSSLALRMAGVLAAQGMAGFNIDPSYRELLNQARLWQARNRDDLVIEALNKLLRLSPENPDALAQLAYAQLRLNQLSQMRLTLDRLRRARPDHADIPRIDTLLRLEGEDKDKLRQARALAKAGKREQALATLRELYPSGPPTGDLTLEYWGLVGSTSDGWQAAYAGLSQLVRDYPDNLRYRLALADHITTRTPDSPQALRTIRELATLPLYEKAARSAWRNAMLKLEPRPASIALIEEYLAQEKVEDTAVKEHLDSLKLAIERHRQLMADPYYRAKLDGLAALQRGKLEQASDLFTRSLAGRPNDAETLGSLGLIRLREGHHAEAQAYFLEAQRRDRGSSWGGLAQTARFWGLLREAADAEDAREFSLAEQKIREARAIDPREAQALIALGGVYAGQGRTVDAEKAYRDALAMVPASVSVLRGLANVYLRSGREQAAEALLTRLAGEPRRELEAAINATRASIYKEEADALLAQKDTEQALAMMERAARYDPDDPWLRLDMARLYTARGDAARGRALFENLLRRRPDEPSVRYAYAMYQARQDQEVAALTTLERIAQNNRTAEISRLQRRLWVSVAARRALELKQAGRNGAARQLLADAEIAVGKDAELGLGIADAWIDIGDIAAARAVLSRLAAAPLPDPDWRLTHARLTLRAGPDSDARALVAGLDGIASTLTPEQTGRLTDLKISLALRQADRLRDGGRLQDAMQALAPLRAGYPQEARLLSAEARLLRALNMPHAAQENYRRILADNPEDDNAALGLIETLIAAQQFAEARALVDAQLANTQVRPPDVLADLAGALLDLQEYERAWTLVDNALAWSPENPRLLAYAGSLAQRDGDLDRALDYLQQSMASELAQRDPASPARISMLMLSGIPGQESGAQTGLSMQATVGQSLGVSQDASAAATAATAAISTTSSALLRPGLLVEPASPAALAAEQEAGSQYRYRNMADLIDRRTTWISAAADQRTRSGSAGKSEYSLTEIPFEWKAPENRDGRFAFRADLVKVSAGTLDLTDPGATETFGSTLLCQQEVRCSTGGLRQSASGVALNAGLERDNLRLDIGTTPLGFPIQNLIGGALYKGDLGPFSYSVDASRRPLVGSVLSYAGARDPNTGQLWGGVLATGVRFGMSLDDGGRQGYWSSLGLHRLGGTNVLGNNRMQLMGGAILRVINEDDRLLSVGATAMLWRMSENAGEYTFGHGGYYSPSKFKSLSLPVTFGERHTRFSYTVRGSISTSRSETREADYFPTNGTLQSLAREIAGVTPVYGGGDGRGTGKSLSVTWEYQTTPSLFIGGRMQIDRSQDYAPNRFLFYLRLAQDKTSAKPVMFPPEPINPISQY
jgi:tetratricopeptide (TPR) repeat protein